MPEITNENDFMASLLADLDESIFSEELTPESKPGSKRSVSLRGSQHESQPDSKSPFKNRSGFPGTLEKLHRRLLKESQERSVLAEIKAATEDIQNNYDDWIDTDFDRLPSQNKARSYSPTTDTLAKRRRTEAQEAKKKDPTQRTQGIKQESNTGCQVRNNDEVPTDTTFLRCIVESVRFSEYIPDQYREKRASLPYTTTGVKQETVRKAVTRKEVIIHLSEQPKAGQENCSPKKCTAILRDEWLDTKIHVGDTVNVIGTWSNLEHRAAPKRIEIKMEDDFEGAVGDKQLNASHMDCNASAHPTIIFSSKQAKETESSTGNLLIVHPDILLSATAISAVVTCARKPLLQAKVKESGPGPHERLTDSLVMGRMLHEVLQSCLTGKGHANRPIDVPKDVWWMPSTFPLSWSGPPPTNFSEGYVKSQVLAQISKSIDDLLQVNLDTHTARSRLWEAALPFGAFANTYLGSVGGQTMDSRSLVAPIARVMEVFDVEEDIWSPMYGIKGFIDVSAMVQLEENTKGVGKLAPVTTTTQCIMPLELKTGHSIDVAQHRAQTMLYTLMMSDRYQRPIEYGLLYYSKSQELQLVRRRNNEIRGLILARNDLASYLVKKDHRLEIERSVLPPTIDNDWTCSRCYVNDICMLYKRAVDNKKEDDANYDSADEYLEDIMMQEESAIAQVYTSKTSHLTHEHLAFFRKWDELLTLEESDNVRYRREMWTMTAAEREKRGRCFANMVMEAHVDVQGSPSNVANMLERNVYIMRRHSSDADHLLAGNLSVGDPICVSIEPDTLSVAQGHITQLRPDHVTIAVDKPLEPVVKRLRKDEATFRLDREELMGGMARVRYNLAKLFFAAPLGDTKRRELIVDLHPPRFREVGDGGQGTTPKDLLKSSNLNGDQLAAIKKVCTAQDYALIVGMPGTGKTATVAELITVLARQGKSILLASYTHSAVDTICRKLLEKQGVHLVRLGTLDRVHKDVQKCMLPPLTSVEELEKHILAPNVVATTCLSVGHSLFAHRHFDYCIIDEASQITLPASLGPLRYADRFVLVGDPQQLPPLVRDKHARQGGLEISLFERLQKAFPESVVYLSHQYRMNSDIMAISNALVYEGRLRCGNVDVEHKMLTLPDPEKSIKWVHRETQSLCLQHSCYIHQLLSPQWKTIFIDTDGIPARERRCGDMIQNDVEAQLAIQISVTLMEAGLSPKEIGIITPYRQQNRRLLQLMCNGYASHAELADVEVLTADKAQGRDKDVIIISFVRSQEDVKDADDDKCRVGVGLLLHDVRRINVALTRARKKLIVLGSPSTLAQIPILKRLWEVMRDQNRTVRPTLQDIQAHRIPGQELERV